MKGIERELHTSTSGIASPGSPSPRLCKWRGGKPKTPLPSWHYGWRKSCANLCSPKTGNCSTLGMRGSGARFPASTGPQGTMYPYKTPFIILITYLHISSLLLHASRGLPRSWICAKWGLSLLLTLTCDPNCLCFYGLHLLIGGHF